MSRKKAIVYTAISGSYDSLKLPASVNENFDYLCFTDDEDLSSDLWLIVPFDQQFDDKTLMARYVKLLPHRYFSDYEYSIWIDGNIAIKQDPEPLLHSCLSDVDIAMFKSPRGLRSIREEIDILIPLKKESSYKLLAQQELYYQLGYEDKQGIQPASYVVFRRHNQQELIMAMEEWWMHVLTYSKRDQISFPFVAWKQNLSYHLSDHQIFLSHFVQHPHAEGQKDLMFQVLSKGGVFEVDNRQGQLRIVRIGETTPTFDMAKTADHILSQIVREDGYFQVLHGPFKDLIYPMTSEILRTSLSSSISLFPKLLGTYEAELHQVLERIGETDYKTIINVGAGEGYYANGLLKRINNALMFAFEIDPNQQQLCQEIARHNHHENRLVVQGECDIEALTQLVDQHGQGLIICDCEGYENDLLDPVKIEGLAHFDLLVELHDFQSAGATISQVFYSRFAETHTVEYINIRSRRPTEHLGFLQISSENLHTFLSEGRIYSVGWVFLQSIT